MAALAIELGAKVESALTVHVTHVVAGGFGSDKYYVSFLCWPGLTGSTPSNTVYRCYQLIGSKTIISAGLAEVILKPTYVDMSEMLA